MATKGKFPANLFKGKESMSEELKEAKAIKSGKITPMQYAKGEKSEDAKKGNPFVKAKRFEEGGEVDALEEANKQEPIEVPAGPKAEPVKRAVVTKEELEKSGLSLRDYMNKQQGLTRRGEKTTPKDSSGMRVGPTVERAAARQAEADASPEGQYRKADAAARTPERKAAMAAQADADAPQNLSADFIGGPWKLAAGAAAAGLGALGLRQMMKKGSKSALESGGRSVATKFDDVEYLGRSGARKMSDTARIGADDAGKAIANNPTPRLSGPSKQLGNSSKAADDEVASVVSARQAARDKVVMDKDAWAAGPTSMNLKAQKEVAGKPKRTRAKKKKDDVGSADTLGPEDAFKRGGKVQKFAAGGSVRGFGAARGGKAAKCY